MPELISQRYEAYVRQMILIYNELLILIVFIHLGQRLACNMKKKKKKVANLIKYYHLKKEKYF